MRLIVRFSDSDGCTYSCTCSLPFESDSAEQLLCDIEEAANKYIAYPSRDTALFSQNGYTLPVSIFVENGKFYEPFIMTVDEWFATERWA